MSGTEPKPIKDFRADALRVLVFENRAQMGRAAAEHVGRVLIERQSQAKQVNAVFAAAPSQNEFLAGLVAMQGIDWSRISAFHMDEYLGIDPDHPASFRRFLHEHLFRLASVPAENLHLIPGEQTDRPLRVCLEYEDRLLANPLDVVCGGIGDNGHLAFNDPPVADFLDPVKIKVVRLDQACREQQVNDGCFPTIEDVPAHAYTLTIPALLAAPVVSLTVPGPRKAEAVLETVNGPISEACPSTILRRHEGATLFLDRDAAKLVL